MNDAPGEAARQAEAGAALFAQGRFEDAIRAWTRALRQNPSLLQAYAGIGEAYLRLGLPRPASMAFAMPPAIQTTRG